MTILVLGTVALDTVTTPFGSITEGLGGSATYFAVSASHFTNVSLSAVIGEDFPKYHLEFLKEKGIGLDGLQKIPGKSFRWTGKYDYDLNNAQTLKTELNVLENFEPDIPEALRGVEFLFLANIDPDLQLKVVEQVKKPKLIACDTMNFWIECKKDSLIKILGKVDLLTINEGEARSLAGESNLVKAARKIRKMGPKTLVIKQGEYGALLFYENEFFSAPGFPLEDIKDPTGAGDSFTGGLMGHLAKTEDFTLNGFRQAVIFGSVMASFNVEAFSCERLKDLNQEDIRNRYRLFKRLTHFE